MSGGGPAPGPSAATARSALFPENRRTVYRILPFVGDRLLHETSMRNHPLTPMTDANLIRLMDVQSSRKSGLIRWKPSGKAPAVKAWMDELAQGTRGSSATRFPTIRGNVCGPSGAAPQTPRHQRAAAARGPRLHPTGHRWTAQPCPVNARWPAPVPR